MKKLVIVIAAIIVATMSMTACGSMTENYELEDYVRYELTYEQAVEEGYTDYELVSYMRDYAFDNDIHVNEYFIETTREEGKEYYLVNDDGFECHVYRDSNGSVWTTTNFVRRA